MNGTDTLTLDIDVPATDEPTAPEHPAMSKWSGNLVDTVGIVWRAIQRRHMITVDGVKISEVPDIVVTVAAGVSRKGQVLGHFAPDAWQNGDGRVHELMIGSEGLSRGAVDVLATLLHEAGHGIVEGRIRRAIEQGADPIKARSELRDTSRGGRFHNTRFRAVAIEVGLGYPTELDAKGKPVKPEGYAALGWSGARMTDETAHTYRREIERLDKMIIAHRRGGLGRSGTGDPDAPKTQSTVPAVCGCTPKPRKIRLSRSTLEAAPITCGDCGEDFREEIK